MDDRDRLEQLGVLIDRLGRLPASPDRDWMIAEVRARKVDVETGVRPGPMRTRESHATIPPGEAASAAPPMPAGRRPRRATPSPSDETRGRTENDRMGSRADGTGAVRSEIAASPSVAAPDAAGAAGSDERVDLLELGGVLCLGDLPADASENAGRFGTRLWTRGLRG
jgi:hypothetical protein